ncbi:MAG: precorrin-8X methylmutase, partial [Oscillospiraceae bacterium]|nr:precorrin-8X methylmutase [Oscillospiraceae bacterium]
MIRSPGQIERGSMEIIRAELRERGITPPPENEAVILRCIHASADFDYAANLRFTPDAVQKAMEALHGGTDLVT